MLKIQLKDIPEEGKTFHFSRKDGKLDSPLADLTGKKDYEVEVSIQPIGGAFTVQGRTKFLGEDLCSRCGWDITLNLSGKIHEYLVVEKERDRTAHSPHGNKAIELESKGPETTYLTSSVLDLGEFVHEQFALLWPDYPRCEDVAECEKRRQENEAKLSKVEDRTPVEKGHPAFKVLDKLKRNN